MAIAAAPRGFFGVLPSVGQLQSGLWLAGGFGATRVGANLLGQLLGAIPLGTGPIPILIKRWVALGGSWALVSKLFGGKGGTAVRAGAFTAAIWGVFQSLLGPGGLVRIPWVSDTLLAGDDDWNEELSDYITEGEGVSDYLTEAGTTVSDAIMEAPALSGVDPVTGETTW